MFLLRDGTGLRNMTLKGLSGEFTEADAFLIKRVTAGAFAALDPGWGPDDSTAWVGTKSPYIQNITNFGTKCVGLKVDGSLHNGGNQTIVCNDFTQILSDGIGFWASGGGKSELVSVFTYYNYIGYLAEDGSRVRSTNGNNSYGRYGAIADGVDVNVLSSSWRGIQLQERVGEEWGAIYGRAFRRDADGNILLSSTGAPRYVIARNPCVPSIACEFAVIIPYWS